jgi:osmotically inducible protein OsmC
MMPIRTAEAEWRGDLVEGGGHVRLGSGAWASPYDFRGRTGEGNATNPEEMLGAAHAGCFSMTLAYQLSQAGFTVERIHTTANVHFEQRGGGWSIHTIVLATQARVPGISAAAFIAQANHARRHCPVSRALAGVAIQLNATLI